MPLAPESSSAQHSAICAHAVTGKRRGLSSQKRLKVALLLATESSSAQRSAICAHAVTGKRRGLSSQKRLKVALRCQRGRLWPWRQRSPLVSSTLQKLDRLPTAARISSVAHLAAASLPS